MDTEECYRWGELFTKDWVERSREMADRAAAMGLVQEEGDGTLIWQKDSLEQCRWVFLENPTDKKSVRAIYGNDENIGSPACYVVVKQDDPSDDRGDVIFDIFRLNSKSLLWHFNRVYTPPKRVEG